MLRHAHTLRDTKIFDDSINHPAYLTEHVDNNLSEILSRSKCSSEDLMFDGVHLFYGYRGYQASLARLSEKERKESGDGAHQASLARLSEEERKEITHRGYQASLT